MASFAKSRAESQIGRARLDGTASMGAFGITYNSGDDSIHPPAELVLRNRVHIPGDCVPGVSPPVLDPPPVPAQHHAKPSVSIPAALMTTPYVFVRCDAHRSPLDRPYLGPYRVISRSEKTFLLDLGNRQDKVSIDRLKPAPNPVVTRSGRISRQPVRLGVRGEPCGHRLTS